MTCKHRSSFSNDKWFQYLNHKSEHFWQNMNDKGCPKDCPDKEEVE